jgi:hypothetical protein
MAANFFAEAWQVTESSFLWATNATAQHTNVECLVGWFVF